MVAEYSQQQSVLRSVLHRQFRNNPANAPVLAQAEAAITALETGQHPDIAAMHPVLQQHVFAPAVQDSSST